MGRAVRAVGRVAGTVGRVAGRAGRAAGGIGRAVGDATGLRVPDLGKGAGDLKNKLAESVAKTGKGKGLGDIGGVLSSIKKPPAPGTLPLPGQVSAAAHSLATKGGVGVQTAKEVLGGQKISSAVGSFKAGNVLRDL